MVDDKKTAKEQEKIVNSYFDDVFGKPMFEKDALVMDKLESVIKFLRTDEKLKLAYLNKFNMYNN